jgi:WD40 repeat protein
VDVENGRQVKSVHFFNEAWVDEEATRYLLVQSEIKVGEETSGRIEFVALKPKMGEMVDKGESKVLDVKSGLTIATSPVDSIFATGDDAGTVTVWFASPTWDKPGKVFDLEGHRGAAITSIAFGENGQTLVTADKNNRLFGWMSKDSLMKTSK